jgi:signal transduction histidine kinase
MRFERKIFIAVFCSTLMIGSLLIWAAHRYVSTRSEQDFISRYNVLTHVLADTLTRLDTSTETLMMNAAEVISARDAEKGLLSTDELKTLRDRLGITHIFMVNKDGSFLRSTNEDPHLIPNLYSFCDAYRGLLSGDHESDATPVITPKPEPKPYKFLFIPNRSHERIVEVGVRVDAIAKTLTEAIKADKNVQSMSLYSPDGTSFGNYSTAGVTFDGAKVDLPDSSKAMRADSDFVHFYSKVISSHPRCCQCDKSGTSKNGEYYYVLESKVSKDELKTVQARAGITFILFALGNIIVSFLVAKFLSRRLVKNIRTAVGRVRSLKQSGDFDRRIRLDGKDEVAYLTREFDHLLDELASSQKKIVEAEKVESKVQLARIVAHNIKSPVVAIEMMIPQMLMIPERTRRILTNSVNEIKQLAEKLRNKPETVAVEPSGASQMDELVFLPILLEDLVGQKQIEYCERANMQILFSKDATVAEAFVKVNSSELRSILSNLINNAIESYGGGGGRIEVSLLAVERSCTISIEDHGCGIPPEYMKELGRKQITFKGDSERGLGLVHAVQMVESWGGSIGFQSEMGVGSMVTIQMKRFESHRQSESSSSTAAFP